MELGEKYLKIINEKERLEKLMLEEVSENKNVELFNLLYWNSNYKPTYLAKEFGIKLNQCNRYITFKKIKNVCRRCGVYHDIELNKSNYNIFRVQLNSDDYNIFKRPFIKSFVHCNRCSGIIERDMEW